MLKFWLILFSSIWLLNGMWLSSKVYATELLDNIRFKHVIPESADFLGEILTIHQDSYGFIWVGGKDGLGRYDGADYQIYRSVLEDTSTLSNNVVNEIIEDRQGNLWIATDDGVNYFDRDLKKFTRYYLSPTSDSATRTNRIITIKLENQKTLWMGGDSGLASMDVDTKAITQYPDEGHPPELAGRFVLDIEFGEDEKIYLGVGVGPKIWDRKNGTVTVIAKGLAPLPENLPSTITWSILPADDGKVWLGTDQGLSLYDPVSHSFELFHSPNYKKGGRSAAVWDLYKDSYGELWAVTDGDGLLRWNSETNSFDAYVSNSRDPDALSSSFVRTIVEDSVGDLWIGFYPSGIDVIQRYNQAFNSYRNISDDNQSISANVVTSILESENGDLWIAGDGEGISHYSQKDQRYYFYDHDPMDKTTLNSAAVMTMIQDHEKNIWIGYWNGGVSRFNPITKEIVHFNQDVGNPDALQNPHIFSLYQDSDNLIWAGTMGGGLQVYNAERDVFNFYDYDPNLGGIYNPERIWSIFEDSNKALWLGTHNGLVKVNKSNRTSIRYNFDPRNKSSISNDWVSAILEDSKGRLWFGTHGGGLNLLLDDGETFVHIQQQDGLASDIIHSILEDDQGLIWVSTKKGLSSFDSVSKNIQNYTQENGLQSNQFSPGAGLKTANGDLIFGGIQGFTRFDPKSLTVNNVPPPIVLTDVTVFNKSLPIGEDTGLDRNVLLGGKLKLDYSQNVFTIHYSALNYRISKENQYRVILEGFDNEWHYVGNQRFATYTNLDPGFYTFKVMASNNEGVWSRAYASISIEVVPPPWKTWWAYSLYVLAFLAILLWYVFTQRKIIGYQQSMVENLQQVDALKDEFIASTSHELRTPLFGIIGLADTLVKGAGKRLTGSELMSLDMIIASGKRLVIQVNDILDFSKIRDNSLVINPRPLNLCELLNLVVPLVQPLVKNSPVKVFNEISNDLPAVMADDHRLQQVLINLVSNAIQHTQSGSVRVRASVRNDEMIVQVVDTGKGIPKEKFSELFEQFTQLDDINTRSHIGTGLGLSIAKKLVELQGGTIWVESSLGEGSTFSFSLPITTLPAEKISLSESAKARVHAIGRQSGRSKSGTKEVEVIPDSASQPKSSCEYHILVVDDEAVNRMILSAFLKDANYRVSEAESGEQALEYLEARSDIDLILLDIMMPGMSGFDVCRKVRETRPLHELPILFTTAKGRTDDIVAAYDVGGNDFVDKPVDRKELNARISLHLKLLGVYKKMLKEECLD